MFIHSLCITGRRGGRRDGRAPPTTEVAQMGSSWRTTDRRQRFRLAGDEPGTA
jgi:hypothetical protein